MISKLTGGYMMGFMTKLMPDARSENLLLQHPAAQAGMQTDLLIHVNEALNENQRNKLITDLQGSEGVISAEFTPQRWHLLIVWYDNNCATSLSILDALKRRNLHAQLIGPL
jgi:hypothetical protein